MDKQRLHLRLLNYLNRRFISKISKFLFLLLFAKSGWRFLNTNPNAIGHFTIDIDCFLKAKALGLHNVKGIILCPPAKVSNKHLMKCWQMNQGLFFIENFIICYFLDYLRTFDETNYDLSDNSARNGQPAVQYKIVSAWGRRPPIIKMPPKMSRDGRLLLLKVCPGYKNQPIALIHCRDGKFDTKSENPNIKTQNYRNSDIRSYAKIINFLNKQGFLVIRIGEFEDKWDRSLGYPDLSGLTKKETSLLECYLASRHDLFVGSMSGPFGFACIWGKPIFRLNTLPYEGLRVPSTKAYALPKLLKKDGQVLSLATIFKNRFDRLVSDEEYAKNGLEVMPNDPTLALADFEVFYRDFIDQSHTLKNAIDDRLQDAYRQIVPKNTYDNFSSSFVGPTHLKLLGCRPMNKHINT